MKKKLRPRIKRRNKGGVILTADRPKAPAPSQPSRIAVASVAVAFGAAVAATTVVSVTESPTAQQDVEAEVACGGIPINFGKRKISKSKRTRRLERYRAQRQRRFSGSTNEPKATATGRKRRAGSKLTPRELLRRSIKIEGAATTQAKPTGKTSKPSGKP